MTEETHSWSGSAHWGWPSPPTYHNVHVRKKKKKNQKKEEHDILPGRKQRGTEF